MLAYSLVNLFVMKHTECHYSSLVTAWKITEQLMFAENATTFHMRLRLAVAECHNILFLLIDHILCKYMFAIKKVWRSAVPAWWDTISGTATNECESNYECDVLNFKSINSNVAIEDQEVDLFILMTATVYIASWNHCNQILQELGIDTLCI